MLMWAALAGAVICLIYYVIIIIYAGITASFSWFWLLLAAFFGLVAWGSRYCRLYPKRLPMWLTVPVITFGIAAFAIFCAVEIMIFLGAATSDVSDLDYVIVLGAKVHPQGISNSLRKRLDKAVLYSRENPGTVFVLSGGQGKDEPTTEAQAMYDYMVGRGVSESRLIMETFSTSTVENLAYSKVLIDRAEKEKHEKSMNSFPVVSAPFLLVEDRPVQIGILTSSYHVFRARRIAEKWGIENACGISAGSDIILFPHLCVRECVAILKDQLMGNM